MLIEHSKSKQHGEDPNQMPWNAASGLGLHCLAVSLGLYGLMSDST